MENTGLVPGNFPTRRTYSSLKSSQDPGCQVVMRGRALGGLGSAAVALVALEGNQPDDQVPYHRARSVVRALS